MSKWEKMKEVAQNDLEALRRAEDSYGNSWRRRGGVGAFMMLARKFDRIEHQSEKHGWDIFEAGEVFNGEAGLLDDIRDLRRYLLLVEEYILANTDKVSDDFVDNHNMVGDDEVNYSAEEGKEDY
jgi:hypothetical protein|tara:strand:- start:231 stop:605 length:375 start_codon:yes stop_codon:yes gene_type:complete